MNLLALAVIGGAGYGLYKLATAEEPENVFEDVGVFQGQVKVPPPVRTPVYTGAKVLAGVAMQRKPDQPQLVAGPFVSGGVFAVAVTVNVRGGIWHERHPGSGAFEATEERHTGMNACGYTRWRGPAVRGGEIQRVLMWVPVAGCPADGSGRPGNNNVMNWLSARCERDLADNLSVILWNPGDKYRGNHYDLRFDWAFTPPS